MKALKTRYHYGFWNRYFVANFNTRMALPWTRFFVAMGMTPNQVSVLSFLISIAGMGLIAFGRHVHADVLGAALLIIGLWWDHSDGQVARITKTGTPWGALLDTIFDRFVETGFVLALALGMWNGAPAAYDWPPWAIVFVAVWAAHATLYVRWANIQRDLYQIQDEVKRAPKPEPGVLEFEAQTEFHGKMTPVKTFWIPFAFNRDVSLWMLFFVTLVPDRVIGLAVFALLHTMLGLEKNWYTFRALQRRQSRVIAALLDPDYHK